MVYDIVALLYLKKDTEFQINERALDYRSSKSTD